jgi:Fe(3+) dicitrate transport protein
VTYGFETMFDWSISKTFFEQNENFIWNAFSISLLLIQKYISQMRNMGKKWAFVQYGQVNRYWLTKLYFLMYHHNITEANNSITDKMTTGILERFHRTMLQIFCFTNGKMELEAGATTQQLFYTELQDTGPGIIPSDAQVFIQR